jgi:8-oxo-dGTP pyrophosphatase MutT (NUDIX family)
MSDFELVRQQLDERLTPSHPLRIELDRVPQAAVTILLRELQGAPQLLIIKRAERNGDPWSGHLALPGGRAEPGDSDLLATAARETYEEIGVNLEDGGRFLGHLSPIAVRNPILPQLEIIPFIALAPQNFSIQLSEEVNAIFWVSINQLKRAGLSDEYRMQYGELLIKRSAYPSEAGPIWGITERILTNFLSLLD